MKIFASLIVAFALLAASPATVYASKGFNSGKSFPYIGTDEASVAFIVEAILHSLVESLNLDGGDAKDAAEANEANYYRYAEELAKTLSQLSPSQQNAIWYGS